MKRLFRLLTLILCLELIIGPYMPHVSLLLPQAKANSCPNGFQFDATLNRCLTSEQTAKVMNAVSNCPANDAACYRRNAEQAFQEKVNSGEAPNQKKGMSGFVSTVANAGVIAFAITSATVLLATNTNKCQATSHGLIVAGGVSIFLGDFLANSKHKKRLKGIKSDWDKIVKPNAGAETNEDIKKANATEAQSQAFEMLARSEDSMAATAKMKSKFYAASTAAFAVAAILAGWEGAQAGGAQYSCHDKPAPTETPGVIDAPEAGVRTTENKTYPSKNNIEYPNPIFPELWSQKLITQTTYNLYHAKDLSSFLVLSRKSGKMNVSPSLDEYESTKSAIGDYEKQIPELLDYMKALSTAFVANLNPIPSAAAEAGTLAAAGKGIVSGAKAVGGWFKKTMTNPWGRMVVSAVLGLWAGIMYKHAKSQAEASEKRAAVLRKMRDEFKDASGAINMCAAADRNNISKPECYCYTASGQRNTNRTNSQTCQKLWASKLPGNANYFGANASKIQSCIDKNNKLDEQCNCRKTSQGCLKVGLNNMNGFNPGTFKMLSSASTPLNQIGNGTFDSANVDTDGLVNNALKLRKANDDMLAKKGLLSKMEKDSNNFEKALIKATGANTAAMAARSTSPESSMSPAQAVAALEKELKEADAPINMAHSPEIGGGGPGTNPEQLDLNFGGEELSTETQVAEAMAQDLDYGQTDINNNSTTNIFEVLSNRYQRSGMRRLFDETGATQADAPSTTDISN